MGCTLDGAIVAAAAAAEVRGEAREMAMAAMPGARATWGIGRPAAARVAASPPPPPATAVVTLDVAGRDCCITQ